MEDQNVFVIRKTLKEILGDKYKDALGDPHQTLLEIPYEHLSKLLEKVPPAKFEYLKNETDRDNQDLYNVLITAKTLLESIYARMSVFSHEKLISKSEKYFIELGLDSESDAGLRDLSDLKRMILNERNQFFNLERPSKHFMIGDIMERYFDHCLALFKKSRSEEFMELLKSRKAA